MDTTTQSKSVGYHMPVLIYSSNALTPVISQATVELHFDKHLRAYVDNYNRLVKDSRFENMTLREVVAKAPEGPLLNNAGQVLNHVLYFEQFTPYPPKENVPSKALSDAIDFDFGSFDNFRKMMEDAGRSVDPAEADDDLRADQEKLSSEMSDTCVLLLGERISILRRTTF